MGMYTQLYVNCEVNVEKMPKKVFKLLDYLFNNPTENVNYEEIGWSEDFRIPTLNCSYYFPEDFTSPYFKSNNSLIPKNYSLFCIGNCKNYSSEIETLLDIIEPYVTHGSGIDNMWAFSIYEEDSVPTIRYLKNDN